MTSQSDSASSREPAASRRDFVTAVTAVAAASAAAATGSAQAQAGTNVRHSNPSGMTQPTAYSQVVEVNGPHRLVFVAGQTGVDASGKSAQEFRAQALQAFENIKTALASVGGSMDNVVRLTTYMTDLEQNADVFRQQERTAGLDAASNHAPRQSFFPDRGGRNRDPAATGVAAFDLPLFRVARSGEPEIPFRGLQPPVQATRLGLFFLLVSNVAQVGESRLGLRVRFRAKKCLSSEVVGNVCPLREDWSCPSESLE